MNIKEALKIILCDSQKGVDYNKFIKSIRNSYSYRSKGKKTSIEM